MNHREVLKKINARPFESFYVVTSSGERYLVRHPENAHVVQGGILYLFEPLEGKDGVKESPKVISLLYVVSLEPASGQTA